MRLARFENEADPCKNQEGRPNSSPRAKNLKLSWFVQHRETIQLRIRSARFEDEAAPCKNQEVRPNGSPDKQKISKFFSLYNTGRPSNSGLGLRSPNVERNNKNI